MGRAYRKRRWIILILAFLILASGMCFGYLEADSSFGCAHGGMTKAHSMTSPPPLHNEHQTVEELSGISGADIVTDDSRRTFRRGIFRLEYTCPELTVQSFSHFHYHKTIRQKVPGEGRSRSVIVRYIHHQDGEKSTFMYA